jgi:hypothetical protein
VACFSVVIGVVNQIVSNRRAEEQRAETQKTQQLSLETRQAQLFMQIYNRWNSRDVLKAYGLVRYQYIYHDFNEYLQKYHVTVNPESYADIMTLGTFFEGLGILVKSGLLDVSLVEDLFSKRIIWFYEEKGLIDATRQFSSDPTQWDSLVYLYHVMKQRQQQATART